MSENAISSGSNNEVEESKTMRAIEEATLATTKDHILDTAAKEAQHAMYDDYIIEKYEIRVLILNTGGTFGMCKTPNGYDVQKDWLLKRIKSSLIFYDKKYTQDHFIEGTSVSPETMLKHRIRYHYIEYDPLIDSSELNSKHFNTIATTIEEEYNNYDSFIVIYGTDTMAYMASTLSFMFENLCKTVVITGAQIPISEWRNDAEANLCGAFTAAEHRIPEVCIFFNGKLLRGNRTIKQSSISLNAFTSPNFPSLGEFEVFLKFRNELILPPPSPTKKFTVFRRNERKISVVFVHPFFLTASIFLSAFKRAKAIILETYGMGNFPMNRVDLYEIIEDAINKYNRTVVIVSQCK
jgi:L-asparaginase/Glu-tRNA(Gln) amidotransferase subunit D